MNLIYWVNCYFDSSSTVVRLNVINRKVSTDEDNNHSYSVILEGVDPLDEKVRLGIGYNSFVNTQPGRDQYDLTYGEGILGLPWKQDLELIPGEKKKKRRKK